MSLTVSKKPIEVSIEYVNADDEVIIMRDEYRDKFEGKVKINKVIAKFARPNWSNFNRYIQGCTRENLISGEAEIDSMLLKKNKFNNLLLEIKENDVLVKLDRLFYENVSPEIAIALVDQFDLKVNEEKILFMDKHNIFEKEDFAKKDEEDPEKKQSEKSE